MDYGYDKSYEVPYMSGCFMLFRKNILDKIGGFDENFFMYLEGDLFPVYFILNIYVDMYNRRDRIIPRLLILLLILNAILLNSLPQFLTILSSFHTSLHKTI